MEILLNLVWAALAIFMVALCLRSGNPAASDRRRQIIALVVLVAILFPVISVSDDLMAVQNASETDTVLRKLDVAAGPVRHFLPLAAMMPPIFAAMPVLSPARTRLDAERPLDHELPLVRCTAIRPPPIR